MVLGLAWVDNISPVFQVIGNKMAMADSLSKYGSCFVGDQRTFPPNASNYELVRLQRVREQGFDFDGTAGLYRGDISIGLGSTVDLKFGVPNLWFPSQARILFKL